jgi:hypothetical protein
MGHRFVIIGRQQDYHLVAECRLKGLAVASIIIHIEHDGERVLSGGLGKGIHGGGFGTLIRRPVFMVRRLHMLINCS